jgi:hypothetical protein
MPVGACPFWILELALTARCLSPVIQNPKLRGSVFHCVTAQYARFAKTAPSAIDDTIRIKPSFLRRNHGTA